jgi:hypothetical protein
MNMSRWLTLTLVAVVSLGWLPRAVAQGPYLNPDLGVVPAGYGHGSSIYGHGSHSSHAPAAYGPAGPIPHGPGRTIYRELPDDTGWLYEDSPFERALKDSFRHAYFRVDYLLWGLDAPGQNILGAATNADITPLIPGDNFFTITDPDTGTQLEAVQPTLAGVKINQNNGLRATFGLPVFNAGTFEASVFVLQTSTSRITPPNVRGIITNTSDPLADTNGDGVVDALDFPVSENVIDAVAQAVLIDGAVPPGDNFLLINAVRVELPDGTFKFFPSYQASLKTSVWGAEGNFLAHTFNPNAGFSARPFAGFRYFNFREDLRQAGQYTFTPFDETTGLPLDPPILGERRIEATTNNNLWGPQIGLRAELASKYVTFGVQPKVMLGVNSYRAELMTQGILTPDEPRRVLYEKSNTFGVLGDLDVYSNVRLTSHLSLRVGYNLLWAGLLTRPADNIVYNIQSATGGLPASSAFVQDVKFSGSMLHGLSVGGLLEY